MLTFCQYLHSKIVILIGRRAKLYEDELRNLHSKIVILIDGDYIPAYNGNNYLHSKIVILIVPAPYPATEIS